MSMQQENFATCGAPRARACAARQEGVTLVELMVALLLGLVLTAGCIQVFLSNRATYSFNEGLSRLQENGRFALDTLSYRIRMAGFVGCVSSVPVVNNLNDSTTLPFAFDEALIGFEAAGTAPGATFAAQSSNPPNSATASNWTPSLPDDLLNRVIPGSDIIVVRNFSSSASPLRTPFTDGDKVNVTAPSGTYGVGDVLAVSDCQKASVFQVTGVTGTGSNIELAHTAAGAVPGNQTAVWNTDQAYTAGAELMRAETWIYFVGAGSGGTPALFQGRLAVDTATSESELVFDEIADSVETMQVLYGFDNNGDDRIDEYRTAAGISAADWPSVRAVRVGLLVRSPDETGTEIDDATYVVNGMTFNPVDDRRVRQVFTTTIALRNRLP